MVHHSCPQVGLDMGVFSVKGVLIHGQKRREAQYQNSGNPTLAAQLCVKELLENIQCNVVSLGLTGSNARLLSQNSDCLKTILEIEALERGLRTLEFCPQYLLSLGHEGMYYLEMDQQNKIQFFNRNGQCAAGSGSFWYQQATRLGYKDTSLAQVALEAQSPVKISGRCAVFAKSDMTHAINEGATYSAVSAGLAQALVDLIITNVIKNRMTGPGTLYVIGGVANNQAVMKYLNIHCQEKGVQLIVPPDHEYLNALGASFLGQTIDLKHLDLQEQGKKTYVPKNPLPALNPERVTYLPEVQEHTVDVSNPLYLGVDCGSVSTKCFLLDSEGHLIGGVYLPTAGRPALQVLKLMKELFTQYGTVLKDKEIIACTTGSGRFLSQKILGAEYAVDEITCQAEGVKKLFPGEKDLSIIEIGGEDSKFLQIKNSVLYDYNMNPVCAAGTGSFLENLAELLEVNIKEEFSRKAFSAEYAIDLGDICTLLSQSALASAASRGLPLTSQLASLALSSARNYLSRTVEGRHLEGTVIFTGATAKNHALAAALAQECNRNIVIPPYPDLTGALGAAIIARQFHKRGETPLFSFRGLEHMQSFEQETIHCSLKCEHEHNCRLYRIRFSDNTQFIYGDRCGRYSGLGSKSTPTSIPSYAKAWEDAWETAAGEPLTQGPRVGLARGGLFFELYPFLSAFFRELGAQVIVSSPTTEETLEKGKHALDSEMCYPVEVLMGHYQELKEMDLDYIFIPEVINNEPYPWMEKWPRSFTCPLLQTIDKIVFHSLSLNDNEHLYAQLNFREGYTSIFHQLQSVAKVLKGASFSKQIVHRAVKAGYEAQALYRQKLAREGEQVFSQLSSQEHSVAAVVLGRPYTLYDPFVSKNSLEYARQRGIAGIPVDLVVEVLREWYAGKRELPFLKNRQEEFKDFADYYTEQLENMYPFQIQKMLSAVLFVKFLNEIVQHPSLPLFHIIFQDPFKCGPNAMLRHYLDSLTGYLRLTLDEHTAPAGMVTRLEAFKNTILSRNTYSPPPFYTARTTTLQEQEISHILIPEPTHHARVFAAMFTNYGLKATLLPRNNDKNMSLARSKINGEECLPFIQNVQDILSYLEETDHNPDKTNLYFFQGWACGPCRYGLYAPLQSQIIHRAGYGAGRICSIELGHAVRRFGPGFVVGAFNGSLAMDLLYKMLHASRPYEQNKGQSDEIFQRYSQNVLHCLQTFPFTFSALMRGKYLKPLGHILQETAREFSTIPKKEETRPVILLGGEFYVRLDNRCNEEIIDTIEQAGGEVSLAPASEMFLYTAYFHSVEARRESRRTGRWQHYLSGMGYDLLNRLAHRDETYLLEACSKYLRLLPEPKPRDIMEQSQTYVSEHYGGEPPMTIGRTVNLAGNPEVGGAIFVAPFTCMPGSVVEAQQGILQKKLGIPLITIYYDGKENPSRQEFIESLVFQARQNVFRDP